MNTNRYGCEAEGESFTGKFFFRVFHLKNLFISWKCVSVQNSCLFLLTFSLFFRIHKNLMKCTFPKHTRRWSGCKTLQSPFQPAGSWGNSRSFIISLLLKPEQKVLLGYLPNWNIPNTIHSPFRWCKFSRKTFWTQMRNSTILCKYHIRLPYRSTYSNSSSGNNPSHPPFTQHAAPIIKFIRSFMLSVLSYVNTFRWAKRLSRFLCLFWWWWLSEKEKKRKRQENAKHIFIASQRRTVLTLCLAVHTIFKLVILPCISRSLPALLCVENIFLWQSLGYLPLRYCAHTCWQKVDDEENIMWHFRSLHAAPHTPIVSTMARPISQGFKRYKCEFSSSRRPDRSPFFSFLQWGAMKV